VSSSDDAASRAARLLNEVEAQLRRGDKIGAIKVYRTATGTGLKEAKDTVDAVERAMQAAGEIEARPGGLLAQIAQAVARWRDGAG
jgi:ribosomal protein L7/L12